MSIIPKREDSQAAPRLLVCDQRLAAAIGLQEAIIVTRLRDWQQYNAARRKYDSHYKNDKWWTYNDIDEWVADFGGCFTKTTLGRYLRALEKMKLVESYQFFKANGNMKKWYHVDEIAVSNWIDHASTLEKPSRQNGKMVVSNRRDESTRDSLQSSFIPKQSKHQQQTTRAQKADVDGDDFMADSGEETLTTENTKTPRFEETKHEASAPDSPSPSSAAPLPRSVQKLVENHGLNPITAASCVAKYGEDLAIVTAQAVEKSKLSKNPAGLWITLIERGDYKGVPRAMSIDDFVVR